ncbi:MAG: amino acid ABC transporter permease [Acidimicrobiales bacterium]
MQGLETDTEVVGQTSVTKIDFREGFPYWLVVMIGIIGWMALQVIFSDNYREAFNEIIPGLRTTLILTVASFVASMFLGLFIGIARISKRPWINTPATVYIEFIRGVPMIVFIFAIALMAIPESVKALNSLFGWEIRTRSVSNLWRGGIALCLFYAAFIAEVFRAGIQSVPAGQIEAGKAVGLKGRQVMRHITLPQAIRNTLPALGNDLIALMKDTSLVSVIAAAELTYNARIYQGSSFRVRETFFILMVIYVTLTLVLSLMLRWYEARLATPGA